MEDSVKDMSHCEEQLRTTLYCDDKEKLRRKLLQLKKEYLRTAERLQRAERSEAVRRHVRSRITQQNHQDQTEPEITAEPCQIPPSQDTQNKITSDVPEHQGPTGDSELSRRSPVIRFLLPSDAACPQTPGPSHDEAKSHRPSPALRLRSQRSRLLWEKRTAEGSRSTENSEEGLEPSERTETSRAEGSEERVETGGREAVNESEELFSSADSESPSLLLTHWNTCGPTETGNMEGKEKQRGQEKKTELRAEGKKQSERSNSLLTCGSPAIHTEGKGQDGSQNKIKETEGGDKGESSRGDRIGQFCEDSSNQDTEQNAAEGIESEKSHDKSGEIKEEKSEVGGERDVKGAGLLDSCTLVEGLLFPAEYYVRTTRRMTLSQSQPDMQAVILSQLSNGRPRRSRGRGRGRALNRHTHNHERSDEHSQTDFSLLTAASPSVGRRMESQVADAPAELNSPSSSEISDRISACQIDTDACFSPKVTAARPGRGRKKRRGRGRGRPQTPRCVPQPDLGQTSDDPLPTSSPVSSFPSLERADGQKTCLTPQEAVPVPDDSQPASIHSTATQPSSGDNRAQCSSASGHQVYPIFLNSSGRTNRSSQMSRCTESWRSLLLPSSPPAQTSLLPLPSLSPSLMINNLMNFDIPQDFHLPDDQFASLKLHKLRQVAVESGVERFTSPSFNTRRSIRRSEICHSSGDPVMPHPLQLSLTPTIPHSPNPTEAKQTSTQSIDLQTLSREHELTGKLTSQADTVSTESVSVVQDRVANCGNQYKESDTVKDDVISKSDELKIKESSVTSSEKQPDCPGSVLPLEDQGSTDHQKEDKALVKTLSFEEPFNTCTSAQTCNGSEAPGGSPVQHLNANCPDEELKESSKSTTSPARVQQNQDKCPPLHSAHSQLLMSPPQASTPFITPHLRSPALLSSPTLPSLGFTPHPAALPLTSSPSAPALTLPPPHSPSIQALSPPALSQCPSFTSLPPSQPPASPVGQIQALSEQYQRVEVVEVVEPATSVHSQGSGRQMGLTIEEAAEEHMMRGTHTLKAPAGGCLVDACCLLGSSGGLCVAAAGKWAVCLWSQTSASKWSLIHTWDFSEPVINVFPVPDAAGLICVTLGQLEIREVRMLSCSSLLQVLLCDGPVQAVAGVSRSRVVTSSHSASGSTLQVLTLSDSGSTQSCQPIASPGVCVGALAPVDGLSDALIGTDEGGFLFVWNLKTGQLLRKIVLGDGLSHTACLRGYSSCGVLFVLLQLQLLSPEEEEESKKSALLSLIALNPLSGKSVLATHLYPHKAWSGRLCEADVNRGSVVGLSQNGSVCVWELGRRGASRMVSAPESEGWQLARWGAGGTLLTGHHNGDVTLHYDSTS